MAPTRRTQNFVKTLDMAIANIDGWKLLGYLLSGCSESRGRDHGIEIKICIGWGLELERGKYIEGWKLPSDGKWVPTTGGLPLIRSESRS